MLLICGSSNAGQKEVVSEEEEELYYVFDFSYCG